MKPRKRSVSLVIGGPGGTVLLVRRPEGDESLPGEWGLPAATLAEGESEEDAARRAGRTKLGVEVEPLRPIGAASDERPGYSIAMRGFEARIVAGEPSVPQPFEGTQYEALRWGDASELVPAARGGSLCSRVLLRVRGIDWGRIPGMDFGITMFATDYAVDPVTLGRLVEERGFHSLFLPEHTHIPASRETRWPGGDELPRQYWRTHDPFVALGAIAATTERIRIGTGICLVVQRDPIITAKEVASLDTISGGRFEFGVGAGWNLEEMRNHGTDPRTRFALMRERIEAMKAIWSEDEPEYHGRFVDFDPLWSWPKPLQQPHPPILVGGTGERVLERVVAYGDEWMPTRSPDPEALGERIAELQRMAAAAGRDPIPVTAFGMSRDPAKVERFEAAGVTRGLFLLPDADAGEIERRLDELAELAGRVRGAA